MGHVEALAHCMSTQKSQTDRPGHRHLTPSDTESGRDAGVKTVKAPRANPVTVHGLLRALTEHAYALVTAMQM